MRENKWRMKESKLLEELQAFMPPDFGYLPAFKSSIGHRGAKRLLVGQVWITVSNFMNGGFG